MKLFLAFGVAAVSMAGIAWSAGPARVGGGQFGGQFGGRTTALGGPTASRGAIAHPLGGFSSPGIGFNRGNRSFRGTRERRDVRSYIPYGYSYYVPGYFDYLDPNAYFDPSYSVPPASAAYYGQAPPEPTVSQQPVIINQYFGMQGPQAQNQGPESINDSQTSADAIGTSSNYYLIA
jgi:hypothetical protein